MKNKIRTLINWLLIIMTALFFISGFALTHQFGCNKIMPHDIAHFVHINLAMPYLILIVLHICMHLRIKWR